jgi:hypothetical protein
LTATLLFVIAGCEFFTSSPFPGYVTSILRDRSVSSWIDDEDSPVGLSASANLLETTVVLRVERSDGEREIVFFDGDLDLLADYTAAELVAASGAGSLGRLGGIDLRGRVSIGQFVFDPDFNPEPFTTGMEPDAVLVTRFDEENGADNRMLAFRVNTAGNLEMQVSNLNPTAPYAWTAPTTVVNGPVGPAGPYRVEAGFAVDEEGVVGGDVLLFIRDESSSELFLVFFSYGELPGTVATLPSPAAVTYIENVARARVSFDNVASDGTWITTFGVVVKDEDKETYRAYGFEGGLEGGIEFDGLENLDHEAAFPVDASSFFVLDRKRERVLELSNWW